MTDWHDTVMNQIQMAEAIIESNTLPMGQALIEHQAIITWKAREPEVAEARKAGIKEVADWVEKNAPAAFLRRTDWQAKLKEWRMI